MSNCKFVIPFSNYYNFIVKDNEKKWILYNLAGLYWRVEGDNEKAIECLRRSVHYAPASYADIPLVSMSNIMWVYYHLQTSIMLLLLLSRF